MRGALLLVGRVGLLAGLVAGIVYLTVIDPPVSSRDDGTAGSASGGSGRSDGSGGAGGSGGSGGSGGAGGSGDGSTDPAAAPVGSSGSRLRGSDPEDPPAALFVGDADTAGSEKVPPARTFACLTAQTMGWVCNNGGKAGSGYVTTRDDAQPYWRIVPGLAETYLADYVVVSGGRTDPRSPVGDRLAGAKRTLDAVRATYPRAEVIVVGPFWVDESPPRALVDFNTQLRVEARRRSHVFVDALSRPWMTAEDAERFADADGVHLTRNGHEHLAGRLVDALKSAGIKPAANADASEAG